MWERQKNNLSLSSDYTGIRIAKPNRLGLRMAGEPWKYLGD
jgi:hypothetical protein